MIRLLGGEIQRRCFACFPHTPVNNWHQGQGTPDPPAPRKGQQSLHTEHRCNHWVNYSDNMRHCNRPHYS